MPLLIAVFVCFKDALLKLTLIPSIAFKRFSSVQATIRGPLFCQLAANKHLAEKNIFFMKYQLLEPDMVFIVVFKSFIANWELCFVSKFAEIKINWPCYFFRLGRGATFVGQAFSSETFPSSSQYFLSIKFGRKYFLNKIHNQSRSQRLPIKKGKPSGHETVQCTI